jgi:NAD(P)-dependent dehydrogenase (short-subunit alcohol dehydrogenase family)
MDLDGKVVVVTGGASGIGRALARRFHAGGASVAITDRDAGGAEAVAVELDSVRPGSAIGLGGNVGDEGDVVAGIDRTEAAFGPIDLYCANAGVGLGTDLETTDDDWRTSMDVNLWAHVYAARALVPRWLERGQGYLLVTASAAGLLTQIGSAPYAVSKHAAVAFAEWLSVTYGDRGVRVSCLCPMGVNTAMLNPPGGAEGIAATGGNVVKAAGEVLEPEQVAEIVVSGLADERFLILPHPEVLTFLQRKTSDADRWLAGMRRLQARVGGDSP